MQAERFTPHILAEILRDLFRSEASGRLILTADTGEEFHICLVRGLVDVAMSIDDPLAGIHPLVDADVSVPAAWSTRPPSPEDLAAFLGDAIEQADVIEGLAGQTKTVLQAAFSLSGGHCALEQGDEKGFFDPDIPRTLQVFLAGIAAISRWAPVRRVLSTQDRVLRPCSVPLFPIECLPLAPEEGYLLSCMDGRARFDDLIQLLPGAGPERVTRFVYASLVLGFVEFDPALVEPFQLAAYADSDRDARKRVEAELERIDSFYASIQVANPYRMLGVTDGVSWNEIKQAYEERKAEFSADRFLATTLSRRREEIRIIETALVEAFLKIQSLRMNAAGEKGRDRPEGDTVSLEDVQGKRRESVKTERQEKQAEHERQAQRHYQAAREYFAKGDFHNSVQYCRLSIRHDDTIADCHALLGEALGRNPAHRWQLEAEQSFKKAIALDPWNARLYLKMADFYRAQGMTQRAARLQDKAFEISPSLREERAPGRA